MEPTANEITMRSQAQSVARLNNLVSFLEAKTDKLKITLFHVTKLLPQTMINEITVAFETAQDTASYEQLLKTLVAAIQKDVSTSLAEGHAAASGSGDAGARDPTEAGSVVGTAAALTAAALMVDGDGSGAAAAANNDTAAPDPLTSLGSGAGANDTADAPDIPPPTSPAAPPAPPVRPSAATRNLAAGTSIVRDAIQNGKDGGDKSLIELEISLGAESKLNILPVANTTEELQESINSAKLSFDLRNAGGLTARFKIGQKLHTCWDKWKQEEPTMSQAELRRKIASMGFTISKTKMSSLLAFATVIKKYKAYRFLYTCTVSWSKVLICMGHDGLEKALENSLRDAPVAFKHLQWDLE
jgi:hypothetical protein